MPPVMMPQKKDNGMGSLLTIGGAVAGGVAGSVVPGAGTIAGAGLGATLGGAAGGLLSSQQAGGQGSPNSEMGAMQRRSDQMGTDNLASLKAAELQLPSLPENLRQQYAPPIIQARMLEQQRQGIA